MRLTLDFSGAGGPHPVRLIKMKYIRVLFFSYYTTITGWGVLRRHRLAVSLNRVSAFLGGAIGFRRVGRDCIET